MVAYFAWLHAVTGSWTSWFTAQHVGWRRTFTDPVSAFRLSWHRATAPTVADFAIENKMEIVFALFGVVLVILLLAWRRWPEAVYLGLSVAALVTSTFYYSIPRNALTWFPAFGVLAELTARPRWRWLHHALLWGGGALLAVNALLFVQDRWVG